MDEVVFLLGDLAIVRSVRAFGAGFNCYERLHPEGDELKKINPIANHFTIFKAAMKYLDKYKSER